MPRPQVTARSVTPASRFSLSNGCHLNDRGVGNCGTLVGAAYGGNADPSSWERDLGRNLGVRRTYWRADQVSASVKTARADLAAGRIPWMSFSLALS